MNISLCRIECKLLNRSVQRLVSPRKIITFHWGRPVMALDPTEASDVIEKVEDGKDVNSSKASDLVDAPKRKVGLLLAFCGKNYYGLQLNRGDTSLPTIEGALFKALVKAKVVPEICIEKSQQMKYSSSSRTDKGVSTSGLVVSLKLRYTDGTVNLINEHLPPDIRVLDIKRGTKAFHAKNNADARTYSYTMPTFAFATCAEEEATEDYRLTDEKLKHIKTILYRYKGTHSFHNFTSGKKMGESSAKRYIINFWNEPPFIHESMEFITLKVKGQSFMIHQIRKMIGLVIAMVNGYACEQHYIRAFSEPLEDIPKAPGTGLILEEVHYQSYNKKHGHLHGGMDWSSCAEKADEFKKRHILPVLYKDEIVNKSMKNWLEGLKNHDFTGIKAKEQWNRQVLEQQEKAREKIAKVDDKTSPDENHSATTDLKPDIAYCDTHDDSHTNNNGENACQPRKKVKLDNR